MPISGGGAGSHQPVVAVAPMMRYTDRHFRRWMRLCSPALTLFTEMSTALALCKRGEQHPDLGPRRMADGVVFQVGGHEPSTLAEAAQRIEAAGYAGLDLNVGCPSERVQHQRFGACLMREPERVRDGLLAMRAATSLPLSVKTRLGVDDDDSYAFVKHFIATVAESGVKDFTIHARKAWLKGLSPRANRHIPPLDYERVYRLQSDFPTLRFVLNGGLRTVAACQPHLHNLHGVMIGRAAYQQPWMLHELLASIDPTLNRVASRDAWLDAYMTYCREEVAHVPWSRLVLPCLNLSHGMPNGKAWKMNLLKGNILPIQARESRPDLDVMPANA